MDIISRLKALPEQLQRIIIYSYLPRDNCANLLLTPGDPYKRKMGVPNSIFLKYVSLSQLKQKYKTIIWEELRPSKLGSTTYGDTRLLWNPQKGFGGQFLIFREWHDENELLKLLRSFTEN